MISKSLPVSVNQFNGKLVANIMARVPIIGIDYKNTDKCTLHTMLTALFNHLKMELWLYSLDKDGRPCIMRFPWKSKPKKTDLYSFVPKEEQTEEGLHVDKIILDYVLPSMGTNQIFAFFDEDFDWSDIQIQLAEKAHGLGQTVIVLTDNLDEEDITPRLKKFGFFTNHWVSNEEELAQYLGLCLKEKKWPGIKLELGDKEIRRIASLLTGYGFLEAEKRFNVFVMLHYLKNMLGKKPCIIDKTAIDAFEKEMKTERQKLESSQGLEQISLEHFNENSVAGLENLKSWLKTAKELSTPQKIGEMRMMGWNLPRGVLLMGVPGCGKSLSAKCIAASFEWPLYRLDFATVQNMWIGESERQLKAAFDFADTRSPCLLWIDEIEKGLSVSDNDPYTRKLLGMFLTYLQESKSNVFVVATSNDVQKLPPELLRKGRFDEIFFVDLPNEAERKEILKMYLKKYLRTDLSENFAKKAVVATEGFAASDIEGTLSQLGRKKLAYENTDISEEAILKLFKEATSVSRVNPGKIEAIREWGFKHAVVASKSVIHINIDKKRRSI
ncbi:MAG: AAA family ATPase [Fibromonadaceae bacterium]|jgi:AAA+ superfamily predicted ATPase|nr:AAA family ATPase [Fibromonadaceae bacterium]